MRHREREAVAKCLGCGGAVCRECVAEHAGKIFCAPCRAKRIAAEQAASSRPRGMWGPKVRRILGTMAACFVVWFLVMLLGRMVLGIPVEAHDGTVWRQLDGQEEAP